MEHLDALRAAWIGHLQGERGQRAVLKREYIYASGRRSCVRRMALDLTHPEDDTVFSDDSLERMTRGEEREAAIVARLMQIGPRCSPPFTVTEGQKRFEIRDRDDVLLIRGKIDCRLRFKGARFSPITEVKSGESVRHLTCLEDFEHSPWTRHMPDQLLSYLLAENEPDGLFILDRPGLPLFIPIHLEDHLARAERFLVDARAAIDAAKGLSALPPMIRDAAECRRCPHFGKSCTPDLGYGPGIQIIADEHLIELAERREKTKDAAKEYERVHGELKDALRGVEMGVLGPFAVSGKWKKKTVDETPKDIREKYQHVEEKGSFVLDIQRAKD